MVYNYETEKPIPDLQEFLDEMVVKVLVNVFFQHRSNEEIDMLRLPLIMSKSIRKGMVNNDVFKRSLMEKEFTYSEETLVKFQEMLDAKELNIRSIGDLAAKDLKVYGDKLGINDSSKTGEMLKTDIINLSKVKLQN